MTADQLLESCEFKSRRSPFLFKFFVVYLVELDDFFRIQNGKNSNHFATGRQVAWHPLFPGDRSIV